MSIIYVNECLTVDTNSDEEFYIVIVSTFVTNVMPLTDKSRKKNPLPFSPKIWQIQAGWKGRIDIMKSLKEKWTFQEDKKSVIFFKISNAIVELGGPLLVWDSVNVSKNELEAKVPKLKDNWTKEFDSSMKFSEDNVWTWTMDYVNFNNNIYIIICESHDEVVKIEKEIFAMKIKQEIIVPPL